MTNTQALMDALSEAGRVQRTGYHLTLGKLVKVLEAAKADGRGKMRVRFDRDDLGAPGEAMSYRGYYSDLAFEPNGKNDTVAKLLVASRKALGKTFHGYKGGDFVMGDDTPLWVAPHSACGPAIVDITAGDDGLVLETREID